jgi:hypothetical protein
MRVFFAIAVVAVLGFTVATLVVYHGRPTPGAVFLTFGWMAILATGFFLARAVSFDFGVGAVGAGDVGAQRRDELGREKKLLLKAIKEVEFDRDTGKLDDDEAAQAIGRYRARALEILAQLDDTNARGVEARIEEELARRMAAPQGCPKCGLQNDVDATFCKKCGAKIA